MKKILVFSLAYYPDNVSGAEIAIKEITDRISANAIEFHMVTLLFNTSHARDERVGNVTVHRVGSGSYISKIFFPVLAAFRARSLHREYHFDALWAMMIYMLLPAVLAQMVGVRVPHILTLQDGDPYEKVFGRLRIRPFLPLIDRGIRTAARIQAISRYLAQWPTLRGYTGAVEIIPNGASMPSAQAYPPEELDALKKQLGKKDDEIFLISVSRLVHQKAIDIVIRALGVLPQRIRYLCVGEGEERSALEHLAHELGVAERIIFTGQVDRTMTAKYRKISDIFVLPSRSEGQGISFLSTMVSGLPMIATQVGGIADFLFDAERNPGVPPTGFAVDVDNPLQIARAVEYILAHPHEAQAAAEHAKKFARDNYDWDIIANNMQRIIFEPVLSKDAASK